jgi:hypothetical protein
VEREEKGVKTERQPTLGRSMVPSDTAARPGAQQWRGHRSAGRGTTAALTRLRGCLAMTLSVLALLLTLTVFPATPALAAEVASYRCDGDLLVATSDNGAVDATGIPNTMVGTVPGAFVVLRWRGLSLQLPRTNNAGPPSYTDGKWWWSLEDPAHPTFRLRGGGAGLLQSFPCERQG